jgi:succinoglycan biosynthesis protein ExoA
VYSKEMIYLSVILPVRNEERFLGSTLSDLVSQDYPKDRFELIIVDGRSTDGTCLVAQRFIEKYPDYHIRLLDNPGYLSSRGRNIGVRGAKGRLIAVIDGHVRIATRKLFASMEHKKEANGAFCLGRPAPLDVPGLTTGWPFWIAVARKTWLGHSGRSHIYSDYEGFVDPMSSGFAYDRRVFGLVGYFDESFDAAEDVEFHFRLKKKGINAYTSPDLTIYSYPRTTLWGLFTQQARYGVGRARFVRKHPDGLTTETLLPTALLLFFASCPFVVVFGLRELSIAIIYVAALGTYSSLLMATGIKKALESRKFFPGLLIGISIWIIHMALGWGFLKTIFLPKQLLFSQKLQNLATESNDS